MPLLQPESLNMMIVITVMNNVRDYNVDRDNLREVQHACTPFPFFKGCRNTNGNIPLEGVKLLAI